VRAELDRPRAHLVVDDFFTAPELDAVFAELAKLERKLQPGLVRDIGHDGQSVFFEHPRRRNRAVWIRDPSKTLRLFRERLWSDEVLELCDGAREPLFQIIGNCWAPHLQVSSYATGDHYDFHEDEGAGVNLTAVVFLAADPKKIRGGDLVLAYGSDATKVRFRHNRLVIFPSRTPHRVTRVRVDSNDPRDARISLQAWLTYGRPPATPSRSRRRLAPVADRPTFLLAEESIVAAAQALVASSASPDQTPEDLSPEDLSPEDLYWGAFYLSRILSANLRCLVAALGDVAIGPIKIRRRETLEVYARATFGGRSGRVGFRLRGRRSGLGASLEQNDALSLFVEAGRGAAKATFDRVLPPGAQEVQAVAILRRLLARASTS
jgi:hypothetical protein